MGLGGGCVSAPGPRRGKPGRGTWAGPLSEHGVPGGTPPSPGTVTARAADVSARRRPTATHVPRRDRTWDRNPTLLT